MRVLEVKAPEWTRGVATTPDIWRWDQGEWIPTTSNSGRLASLWNYSGRGWIARWNASSGPSGRIRLAYLAEDCDSDSSYERCD